MKIRLSVVTEYSKGRTFDEAVDVLFREGLMNGSYTTVRVLDRAQARRFYCSWFNKEHREAEVKYIIVEKYDEEYEQWIIDYSEGIEILPCQ